MARPESSEHAPYYGKYIALVPEHDIIAAMKSDAAKDARFPGRHRRRCRVCSTPAVHVVDQASGWAPDRLRASVWLSRASLCAGTRRHFTDSTKTRTRKRLDITRFRSSAWFPSSRI